jgi:hypothetical protein
MEILDEIQKQRARLFTKEHDILFNRDSQKALENARSCEGNKRKTVPFDVVASMMLNELSRDEFRRTI